MFFICCDWKIQNSGLLFIHKHGILNKMAKITINKRREKQGYWKHIEILNIQ